MSIVFKNKIPQKRLNVAVQNFTGLKVRPHNPVLLFFTFCFFCSCLSFCWRLFSCSCFLFCFFFYFFRLFWIPFFTWLWLVPRNIITWSWIIFANIVISFSFCFSNLNSCSTFRTWNINCFYYWFYISTFWKSWTC